MNQSNNDITVGQDSDNPADSVSCISWLNKQNSFIFAAGSWDSTVRLYEFPTNSPNKLNLLKGVKLEDPCLSVSWVDDGSRIFAGCINNYITAIDTQSGQTINVGAHNSGVRDVYWIGNNNILCSLGFDKTIKFWDLNSQNPVASYDLGHKVYCSDLFYPYIMCGLSDEKLLLIDITNLQTCLGKSQLDFIDSPLGSGSQLTCVAFFADGSGIGTASHDGRANLSKLEGNMGKVKLNNIMTFKCHKVDHSSTNQLLYPVHSMGFNSRSQDFLFTAGGDGNLVFWDYVQKNKINGHSFNGVPVTKARLDPTGNLCAYALGYDWAQGVEGYGKYKTKICCHIVQNDELKYVKK